MHDRHFVHYCFNFSVLDRLEEQLPGIVVKHEKPTLIRQMNEDTITTKEFEE
jgi:hypothetical protein